MLLWLPYVLPWHIISLCADATVRLTSTLVSGNENDTVSVCVERVVPSPLGMLEADLVVHLSAAPGSAG